MLTNNDILKIAVQQSAYDMSCRPEDFLSGENVVTISQKHPLARKYLPLPMKCDLVSYGSNIVAQASPEIAPLVREYIDRYPTISGSVQVASFVTVSMVCSPVAAISSV